MLISCNAHQAVCNEGVWPKELNTLYQGVHNYWAHCSPREKWAKKETELTRTSKTVPFERDAALLNWAVIKEPSTFWCK